MIRKMIPIYKDYLWGGRNLIDSYNKDSKDIIAESWEFSTHEDGESNVVDSKGNIMSFSKFLEDLKDNYPIYKSDPVGKNWGSEFPLLVKFIDSNKSLSLQVHPNDKLAKELFDEEFGKTEMWHILDSKDDAFLYVGFKEESSLEEMNKHIEEGNLELLLNKVEVKPKENYFINSGTIHAIGAGITLLEIQQKSNLTFRVYDYNRRDKDGNLRDLHLEEAGKATMYSALKVIEKSARKENIICDLFSQDRLTINSKKTIKLKKDSFLGVIIVNGEGRISDNEDSFKCIKGDSFFIPNGNKDISLSGNMEIITFTL